MKTAKPAAASNAKPHGFFFPVLLFVILAVLFAKSFVPDYVHFSNDGPLGQQSTDWLKLPSAMAGMWDDLNDIGFNAGSYSLSIIPFIHWLLGPVGYAKFLPPVALFLLGLGAWAFFRQSKFSPLAAVLGGLAAALNSAFFSTACWGVASQQIAIGMDFFALALIVSNTPETPVLTRWARLALAGLCVGINVIEAADIGAIFSIFIAAFTFFKALVDENGALVTRLAQGVGRVALVAVFAGFIAVQAIVGLVGSSIVGIAGTGQDAETKAAQWDFATQWSMPKAETFSLFVPGLFGYRMDTPKDMPDWLKDSYKGGNYWGGVGRTPAIDRYFDSGRNGEQPPGSMRFNGGGGYAGILVGLVALWVIAQSLRRKDSAFSDVQRKFIWFWAAILVASLLFSWGRFAPIFYGLLYKLPYFSTIRNPTKFLLVFSWVIVILFGYGIHALSRRYLEVPVGSTSISGQLKNWWAKVRGFDRNWTSFCVVALIGSLLLWAVYAGQKQHLIKYLESVGFPDVGMAQEIAAFSIGQVGWFVLLFAAAVGLYVLILAGVFSGQRARLGGILLGGLLVLDLGRANLPWVVHWNYKEKYEVGSLNPILEFLRQKPYEHRVAVLPFETRQQLRLYDNLFGGSGLYRIEWAQHHFPYYNIQSLDIIQMPRVPEDIKAYLEALSPRTEAGVTLIARHWQLTNTRYLLGAAGFLDVLNQQLDPGQHSFHILQRFDVVAKPGVSQLTRLEELTATPSNDGDLALFEFGAALPRAKLYANWQVNTNDADNLKTLADLSFDPAKTVLISTPQKDLPVTVTNENSGTVEYASYAPKHIVLNAQVVAPSVLLLNDKYDPHWSVTVDGRPAELLRCNFIMRGVQLTPGPHTVTFDFTLSNKPLYVSLAGLITGLLLCGFLIVSTRKSTNN